MYKGIKPVGMKVKHILCVCEHGNNRSVTMAHILKYTDNFETLTAGLAYHTPETLKMLFDWAEVIVVPEYKLLSLVPEQYKSKIKYYNLGEDKYPRPFNMILYNKAKEIMRRDKIK